MEIQTTYRQHLTQRINDLLNEVERIHDLVAQQLMEVSFIDDNEEKHYKLCDMQRYLNKADHLHFKIYMLDELKSLLCK